MQLLSREIFVAQGDSPRGLMPGSVTYLSPTENHLLFRYAWESDSDAYDDWSEMISRDNGHTWSDPVIRHRGHDVEGGRVYVSENVSWLDPLTGQVLTIFDTGLRRGQEGMEKVRWSLLFSVYDPATDRYTPLQTTDFGLPHGIMLSFCRPLLLSTERLLIPAQTVATDEQGAVIQHPLVWDRCHAACLLLGERNAQGQWDFHLGQRVTLPMEVTSRGLIEPTVAELADGRVAMIMRGDNSGHRARPGHKWLCFSEDGGESWGDVSPLRFDDYTLLESGSNGSALLRSARNGRLYWIGNPCVGEERAHGNFPRAPLCLYEVQEDPFALRRETMLVIDDRRPADAPGVQLSNFRVYEDRETGDFVLFMSRLGEKDPEDWRRADLYRYRIGLD
jgi:hypothetical protein